MRADRSHLPERESCILGRPDLAQILGEAAPPIRAELLHLWQVIFTLIDVLLHAPDSATILSTDFLLAASAFHSHRH